MNTLKEESDKRGNELNKEYASVYNESELNLGLINKICFQRSISHNIGFFFFESGSSCVGGNRGSICVAVRAAKRSAVHYSPRAWGGHCPPSGVFAITSKSFLRSGS